MCPQVASILRSRDCQFSLTYGDKSAAAGFLLHDLLALAPTPVSASVVFGYDEGGGDGRWRGQEDARRIHVMDGQQTVNSAPLWRVWGPYIGGWGRGKCMERCSGACSLTST